MSLHTYRIKALILRVSRCFVHVIKPSYWKNQLIPSTMSTSRKAGKAESAREKSSGTNTDQHLRTSWRRDFPLGYRHVSVVFPNRKSNMRQTNMITCCSDQLADELVVYFFREQQQHPLFTSFSVCSCCYARVAKTTHSFIPLAARVQNRYAWPIPEQNLPVQHLLFPAAPHLHSPNNIPPPPQPQ